ncbi:MAG: polysaccharide biosynthesis C-terminal domain-containing protein [Candidatus Aquilonibacter sp.]
MSLRYRLFTDGIYTFAMRILAMLFAAALGVLTARVLGTHARGLYVTPMVDAGIVTAAFTGLSSATSYFLLRHAAGRAIVRSALVCASLFVLIGACAAAALAFLSHTMWAAPAAVISLPGPAALMIVTGYVIGTHRVRRSATFATISIALMLAVTLLVFFAAGQRNVSGAIAGWLIATNLMAVAAIVWVALDARRLPAGTVSPWAFTQYALRSGLVGLVTLLNYRSDVYLVAVLGTPSMLGMYTLAVSAAEALLAATQITAVVTAPHVASLEETEAAALAARAVRHNVLVAGVSCVGLAVLAPIAVDLLYGSAFMPVVPAIRILLVGVFALSLGSPMSTYFTIRLGRPEVPLVLASSSAAICIVASILLIPRLGLIGAALASTVAYIAGQSAAILWFASATRIDVRAMLVPRLSDLATYVNIAGALLGRRRTRTVERSA